jgi:hypothetical protein
MKILATLLIAIIILAPDASHASVVQNCGAYPGLVNKIVKCVTRMTSFGVVEKSINSMYSKMIGVSNAAVILYLSIFGFKMATGGVNHLRREAFWVVLTAVGILSFNNTVSVKTFLNIFLRAQTEFANAATFAVATKPPADKPDPNNPDNGASNVENAICYGPKMKNPNYDKNNPDSGPPMIPETYNKKLRNGGTATVPKQYSVWQRIDCIIGYVIGVHPIVEKTSQYFDPNGKEVEVAGADLTSNKRFDYDLFAGPNNPFADMATDPYCMLANVKDINIGGGTEPDGCKGKRGDIKGLPTFEIGVSFSMLVIAIGMFFESAQNGAIGMMVLLTGLFIVFLMISAFGQVVLVYISSMFAIVVLSLFAPLVIPTILFKQTKNIFDSWLQMMFGYMLQPGIMLCYLTFMIFVIQFIITYSKPMTKDANGNISQGFESLVDLNLGEQFTKGLATSQSQVQTYTDLTTQQQDKTGFKASQSGASGEKLAGNVDTYSADGTRLNQNAATNQNFVKQDVNKGSADQTTPRSIGENVQTKDSGSATSGEVGTPSWKFGYRQCEEWNANGKCLKTKIITVPTYITDKVRNNMLGNTDDESFYSGYKVSGGLNDSLVQFTEQDSNTKAHYMQNLLVVFLTLSITISFMHNVMNFADQIAGAGQRPISKMVDIYNMNVSRASQVIRS